MEDWSAVVSKMSRQVVDLVNLLNAREYDDALTLVTEMRADLGTVRLCITTLKDEMR